MKIKDEASAGPRRKRAHAEGQRALRETVHAEAVEKSLTAVRAIREGGATEASVLEMVILLGALGGSLHLVGSLVKYVGIASSSAVGYFIIFTPRLPVRSVGTYRLHVATCGNSESNKFFNRRIKHCQSQSNRHLCVRRIKRSTGKTALDKLAEVFKTIFRSGEPFLRKMPLDLRGRLAFRR